METRTFICQECGEPFEIEADSFIPGVEGFVNGRSCGYKRFVDPTKPHTCDRCVAKILEQMMEVEGSS